MKKILLLSVICITHILFAFEYGKSGIYYNAETKTFGIVDLKTKIKVDASFFSAEAILEIQHLGGSYLSVSIGDKPIYKRGSRRFNTLIRDSTRVVCKNTTEKGFEILPPDLQYKKQLDFYGVYDVLLGSGIIFNPLMPSSTLAPTSFSVFSQDFQLITKGPFLRYSFLGEHLLLYYVIPCDQKKQRSIWLFDETDVVSYVYDAWLMNQEGKLIKKYHRIAMSSHNNYGLAYHTKYANSAYLFNEYGDIINLPKTLNISTAHYINDSKVYIVAQEENAFVYFYWNPKTNNLQKTPCYLIYFENLIRIAIQKSWLLGGQFSWEYWDQSMMRKVYQIFSTNESDTTEVYVRSKKTRSFSRNARSEFCLVENKRHGDTLFPFYPPYEKIQADKITHLGNGFFEIVKDDQTSIKLICPR